MCFDCCDVLSSGAQVKEENYVDSTLDKYDTYFGAVIALNAISIGVETDWRPKDDFSIQPGWSRECLMGVSCRRLDKFDA